MESLNCNKPTKEPKVTEYIDEIISFVEGLIENGAAYAVEGNVYFRVRSFDQYGALSKQDIDDLRSGARIEVNRHKEDPLDFALWKYDDSSAAFDSPWGRVVQVGILNVQQWLDLILMMLWIFMAVEWILFFRIMKMKLLNLKACIQLHL